MDSGFDYEIIARCEQGVYNGRGNDVECCGEPACYKVWWADDMSDAMYICEKHFREIETDEKEASNETRTP